MDSMEIVRLQNYHYGVEGEPVYKLVARERERLGQSKGQFAAAHGIDRASQYRFEAGENRSLALAISELRALGYTVTITAV